MSKVMTAKEAVDLVKDDMTFAFSGFATFGLPEELLVEMEKNFLKTGSPKNLSLFYCGAPGGGDEHGGNHFAHEGMLKKLYGGHVGLTKQLGPLINKNLFPAYLVPQGVNVHLCRAIASGKPGVLTTVGLKTYADPRIEGCRANEAAKAEEIVELVTIGEKDYLLYKSFPIDICFIKGSTADEDGNVTLEREGALIEVFEVASATKNSGGKVIVQVDRLAQKGSLPAKQVAIPGIIVDGIVVGNPEYSRQSYAGDYNPSWSAEIKVPVDGSTGRLELNSRKICARRAAIEICEKSFINFGIGIPQSIAEVLNEEGLADQVTASVESGVIGGIPAGGLGMGAAANSIAMIKHAEMFDLYDGGALDTTFLGAAEIDQYGNVNVTKFNGRMVGPGGFVNISQNTKKVCFCGTFTAGKTKLEIKDGKLNILQDGSEIKFKKTVEQIGFSGEYAMETNQEVYYITERAVFKLTEKGVTLVEIAPGVDLQKHILDKMEFMPAIAEDMKLMDSSIFKEDKMNLILNKK